MSASKTVSLVGMIALLAGSAPIYAADNLNVTIIDCQDHDANYTYFVPGNSTSTANTDVNCSGNQASVNCSSTTRTSATTVPARSGSYDVRGATLSLQLPDGRIAVVNCDSKLNWTDFSRMDQVRRSCKIPPVNNIQAQFRGDKAKLKWPVSIDGSKLESETYKILVVLDKP
ncbi:MAG: hypothetical protein ABSF64_35945 [Bryobacteraceae bacterium]|jgi:hypothetical protein